MSGFDDSVLNEADETVRIRMVVNGRKVACEVTPRETLVDCLRDRLELTGTHAGCEMGACGACLVQLDGRAVHSCLIFAVQADGAAIDTIEGLSERGAIADLQAEFHRRNALQCGFCTPGMLVNAHELLSQVAQPSRETIRRSEEHTSELQSHVNLVCRLLLEKKKKTHPLLK